MDQHLHSLHCSSSPSKNQHPDKHFSHRKHTPASMQQVDLTHGATAVKRDACWTICCTKLSGFWLIQTPKSEWNSSYRSLPMRSNTKVHTHYTKKGYGSMKWVSKGDKVDFKNIKEAGASYWPTTTCGQNQTLLCFSNLQFLLHKQITSDRLIQSINKFSVLTRLYSSTVQEKRKTK